MAEERSIIADALKIARCRAGVSLREMARRLKCSSGYVAKVERGTIAVVTGRITKTRCDPMPAEAHSCGMEIETPDGDVDPHGTRFIITVRK